MGYTPSENFEPLDFTVFGFAVQLIHVADNCHTVKHDKGSNSLVLGA